MSADRKSLKQWFLSRKLNQKVKVIFALTLLSYFIILSVFYKFVIKANLYDYMEKANYDLLISIGNNLNNKIETMNILSQSIMGSKKIVNILSSEQGINHGE